MHTSSYITKHARVIIVIIVLFALSGSTMAQEVLCTDPDILPAEQIVTCLDQGLVQISQLSDQKLAEALEYSPEKILPMLQDNDLIRALKTKINLLEREEIYNGLDQRAISDLAILNDNPDIKKKWFEKYNITDQGCNITKYDGKSIAAEKIIVDKDKASGLILSAKEGLIPQNITIKRGNISIENKTVTIVNGEINVGTMQNLRVEAKNTQIYVEDDLFESFEGFNLTIENKTIIVQGAVVRLNIISGRIKSVTDKEAKFDGNDIFIDKNTTITTYNQDVSYLKITSEKQMKIGINCTDEENCVKIEDDPEDDLYSLYLELTDNADDNYIDEKIDEYKIRNSGIGKEDATLVILTEIDYMRSMLKTRDFRLREYALRNSAPIPKNSGLSPKGVEEQTVITNFFTEIYDRARNGEDQVSILSDIENRTQIELYDKQPEEAPDEELGFLLLAKELGAEGLKDQIGNFTFKKKISLVSLSGKITILDMNDSISTLDISFFGIGGEVVFKSKARAEINKTKLEIIGNPDYIKVNILSDYTDSRRSEHKLIYDYGEVSMCSDCMMYGLYTSEKEANSILKADPKRLYEITKSIRDEHIASIKKIGVGTHYGSNWVANTYDAMKILKKYSYQGSSLKVASCVGYPLEVLDKYYQEVGGDDLKLWKQVRSDALTISRNHPTNKEAGTSGLLGIGLAKALQKAGWKVYSYGDKKDSSGLYTYNTFKKYGQMRVGRCPHNCLDVDGFINIPDNDFTAIGLYGFGASQAGVHVWNVVGGKEKNYMIYEVHWNYGPDEEKLFDAPKSSSPNEGRTLRNFADFDYGFIVVPPSE